MTILQSCSREFELCDLGFVLDLGGKEN